MQDTLVTTELPGTRLANKTVGAALVAGGVLTILSNVVFPRAADPFDTETVLALMAEEPLMRQAGLIGVLAGVWALTAGVLGFDRTPAAEGGSGWSRAAGRMLLAGATLFTASIGLGLAATGHAAEGVAAPASAAYFTAAALNAADDAVFFTAILTFWGALALFGRALLQTQQVPRGMGWLILVLGLANSLLAGLPLALGVTWPGLVFAFAGMALFTSLWAVWMGVWLRRAD